MNKKYSIFMAAMCGVLTFTGCSGQTNTSEAVTQEENTAAVVGARSRKMRKRRASLFMRKMKSWRQQ